MHTSPRELRLRLGDFSSYKTFLLFLGLGALLFFLPQDAFAQAWGDGSQAEEETRQEEAPRPRPQSTPTSEGAPSPDAQEITSRERARQRDDIIRDSTRRQLQSGQNQIHIYQLVEEMIDEVIADLATLNSRAFSPVAFRQLQLTPNLSAQFGEFVESTLITAVVSHTDIAVKRCIACNAMRSRVDNGDWVVSVGMVHHDELRAEAERLGTNAYMDARFSFFPGANIVAMQVELFRADDGAILWSETYRSDATTAAILRTGDRVQSREERVSELERRIDERPYYGHQLYVGAGYLPYDGPSGGFGGLSIGYRLYEKFGADLRYLFGIGAEAFANFSDNGILGSFIYGVFQFELYQANLNQPTVRTGPALGGFFAGSEGNSAFAEWGIDAQLQYRLGAGASVYYFLPTEFDGFDLGGFGVKGRVSFNW